MSYQQGLSGLSLWLERVAQRREAFRAKLPRFSSRWTLLLFFVGLVAVAFLLRCLHLLQHDHFYLIVPDSYFFHWLADRIMAGQGPPADATTLSNYTLHSGLAYPLAYIAKAIEQVFGVSSAGALDLVCKFLPPLLGVISMFIVYLVANKLYGRRVGLLSAFVWAVFLNAVTIGAAGFIDRDGLSLLLMMTGALVFFLSKGWKLSIGGRDVGWLMAGLAVLSIEGFLYLEWTWVGPVLLLAVIGSYVLVKFLLEYFERMKTEQNTVRRIVTALNKVNWRTFAIIVGVNVLVVSINFHQAAGWFQLAKWAIQSIGSQEGQGAYGIEEVQGLAAADFVVYQLFLIPLVLGLYIAWKKRSESTLFFACWFLVMLILGIFAKRVLIYSTPAACVLSGVGLAFLLDWGREGLFHMWKKVGLVVLAGLGIVISFSTSYAIGSVYGVAPDQRWQDALAYLREETPEDSVIITQWSWGYWILDLGQRRPLVDNGYYGWDVERLNDVGTAYTTNDPSEAAQILDKYGADYLIFSTLDQNIRNTILIWAGLNEEYSTFPYDSLFVRSLNGEFESGGGLEVVYRSIPNPEFGPEFEVVILGSAQRG